MPTTLTPEQLENAHRENLKRALKAKDYKITERVVDLLYAKYLNSPPGTTYVQVLNANRGLLTKNCGCR